MKAFLTLSICLVALFSGAQSFRKEKKHLIAEYNQIVQRYDSLCQHYQEGYVEFRNLRRDFATLYLEIFRLEDELKESKEKVLRKADILARLAKLPKEITQERHDTIPVRIANRIVGSLLQEVGRLREISRIDFSLELKGLHRAAQLEYLRNSIADVNNECGILELNYQLLHSTTGEIKSTTDKLASVRELISSRTRFMEGDLEILTVELEKARENFRKNGPNGFSDAYFVEFPELFPDDPRNVHSNEALGALPVDMNYGADFISTSHQEGIVHTYVEESAEFPGGMSALKQYLTDNLRYPETLKEMGVDGKCYLQLIISETGKVTNVHVVRGFPDCPECDKEAIRLVEAMPDWKPAKNGGKPVKSTFNLPVTFKLN